MRGALAVAGLVLVAGCSTDEPESGPEPTRSAAPASSAPPTSPPAPTPAPTPTAVPRADPETVRPGTAVAAVEELAGAIGPRPGTSPAFRRAVRYVEGELARHGWSTERQDFPAPAGTSVAGPTAGLPVEGGESANVVATRGDVVAGEPWLLVGAHLDTVPTGPGAEDNASGVGVVLAVAEALAGRETRLPVVLVAFGAEEPRGPGDAHHYGSKAYVASLTGPQRRSLAGMISLDRVGVGGVVPLGSIPERDPLLAELERAAERVGVPVVTESGETASDHESFVDAGLPGVRIGSTPYAEYHSTQDLPPVVDRAQLGRVARLVVSWVR